MTEFQTFLMRRFAALLAAMLAAGSVFAQPSLAWQHAQTGIEFVWVAGGCFSMGAEKSGGVDRHGAPRAPRADEVPKHQACIDGFWMGKYEVTREQWQRVMAANQPPDPGMARKPAIGVAWEDAQVFLQRVNANAMPGQALLRLPTEAEWEFACLPGEPAGDMDDAHGPRKLALVQTAWYREPRRENPQTRHVGELAANPLGLHDMLGNVWEWTQDVYLPDGYLQHAARNPKVVSGSDRHVLRGGSYKSDITQARCGTRAYGVPNDRLPSVGLRLVRDADPGR